MTNKKKIIEFNMKDIINIKINFTINNTIFDKDEFIDYDEGQLLAYNEMIEDIEIMYEDEFVNKYLKIVENIDGVFEKEEIKDKKEIEKLSGYNNAIVEVLELIDPIYKYDLDK